MIYECYIRFSAFTTELLGYVFFIFDFGYENPKVYKCQV